MKTAAIGVDIFFPATNSMLDENDKRLKNRLVYYLRNLQQAISYELSYEENLTRLSSRFKNLPKQYHLFMKEIIRGFLLKN